MSKESSNHIIPLRTYLMVGGSLFVLTVITVLVSFINLGGFNLVIAMLIATAKALLVALFFMHLLYDNKIFMTIFSIALIFVSVFIILTMFDTLTRSSVNEIEGKSIKQNAAMYDQNK